MAIFLMSVQMGPGPLGMFYMQEVSNYKGVAVGAASNWFVLILIGLLTKPLFDSSIVNYAFIIFGVINSIATLAIYCFVKETKGLSEIEVSKLYLNLKN
jgi:hypothetical protein